MPTVLPDFLAAPTNKSMNTQFAVKSDGDHPHPGLGLVSMSIHIDE
jgi:hypothetical protein